MKRAVVTGCAGFIGSTLTDRLLATGVEVVGVDNFSTGKRVFLEGALRTPAFRLVEGDLLESGVIDGAVAGADTIFHLAANADVRFGPDHPRRDLEQNTLVTHNVLEAARKNGVARIAFSSTGSVYGEATVIPTPEDAPFPVQTSLYGASKVACEALIEAYAESFGIQAFVFRFVSILGERYTHGHVVDFCRQLRQDPTRLRVLGNGRQRKSYLYVQDCIDAILLVMQGSAAKVNRFNLGVDAYCEVNDSIQWICAALGVRPVLDYAGGDRGWTGDNPFIFLDTARVRAMGWTPKLTIRQGVERTVAFLQQNGWVMGSDS